MSPSMLLDKNYYTEFLLYSLNGYGNCIPRSNDLEDFVSHTLDLMGLVSIFNLSPENDPIGQCQPLFRTLSLL